MFEHDPEPEVYYERSCRFLEKENEELKKMIKQVIPTVTYICENTADENKKKKSKLWLKKAKEIL